MLKGSTRQKVLFLLLIGVYAIGLQFSASDKLERVGRPDVGWVAEYNAVSPSRLDASELGLRGGGRALAVNGVELAPAEFETRSRELLRLEPGATNTLRFTQRGEVFEVEIPVRDWTWRDALFTKGAIDLLALLFVATALVSFALRPYEPTSWAILSLATVVGGLLTVALVPDRSGMPYRDTYQQVLSGLVPAAILHTALAFPVVHPLLRQRGTVPLLYGLGALLSLALLTLGRPGWGFDYVYVVTTGLMLATILFLVARCAVLSVRSNDSLIAQRARILLAGGVFGAGPVTVALFVRNTTGEAFFDVRFAYWALALFFLPLGYVSVRHSLVNAGAAVRRALAYGALAGLLTAVGVVVVEVQAYAIALLLFPLLYWWPRFDQRLSARLYPRRARFPQLLQEVGAELATSAGVDELLEVLVTAPARLCEASSGIAFLLPGVAGAEERVHASGTAVPEGKPLSQETLVKLMVTTRREVFRDQIAVEPQYANIQAECHAGFERLGAELILPILRDGEVIGGLVAGPRTSGDVYEPPELFALQTVTQQAVQALSRVEALQRLHAREDEFSELKRFFPPQIIDQVMEQGGAAELRSRRRRVTVFFADLRGFTSFAERVEPEEVMATLAEYHEAMGRRIAEYGGTLERFAGDGFMVFFNDPLEQPDHVERAVRMALAMQRDVARLREQWKQRGYGIDVGMGVHTGFATVGFVGYEGRRDYAVIGNVTNLAARLSDAAGGGEILVTGAVRQELSGEFFTEPAGDLTLKGLSQPQPVHRLLASKAMREKAG